MSVEMQTVVKGTGRLLFRWKAQCEQDVYDHEFDHGEFRIDGVEAVGRIDGATDWRDVELRIEEGEGEHELIWAYVKDDCDERAYDGGALWGDRFVWIPDDDSMKTAKTPVEVPYSWLYNYGLLSVDDPEVAAARLTQKTNCDGQPQSVWQDYVAGTDPTNMASKLTATIKMGADGKPIVSWKPSLNGETEKGAGIREGLRSYTLYGKQTLDDAVEEWKPVAEGEEGNYRFFKVAVGMP